MLQNSPIITIGQGEFDSRRIQRLVEEVQTLKAITESATTSSAKIARWSLVVAGFATFIAAASTSIKSSAKTRLRGVHEPVSFSRKPMATKPPVQPGRRYVLVGADTDEQLRQFRSIPEPDPGALLKQAGEPPHRCRFVTKGIAIPQQQAQAQRVREAEAPAQPPSPETGCPS